MLHFEDTEDKHDSSLRLLESYLKEDRIEYHNRGSMFVVRYTTVWEGHFRVYLSVQPDGEVLFSVGWIIEWEKKYHHQHQVLTLLNAFNSERGRITYFVGQVDAGMELAATSYLSSFELEVREVYDKRMKVFAAAAEALMYRYMLLQSTQVSGARISVPEAYAAEVPTFSGLA